MNMPVFSAEASLYRRRRYRLKAGLGDGAGETAVFPQKIPECPAKGCGSCFQTQRLPREGGGAVAIQPFV
jgi:hypothetical protein